MCQFRQDGCLCVKVKPALLRAVPRLVGNSKILSVCSVAPHEYHDLSPDLGLHGMEKKAKI